MAAEIITKEDLKEFGDRLLGRIKSIIGQTIEQPKKWLRSAQVRKLLNISPGTLTNMRIHGIIKYTKKISAC
ncbi:DNA-binding protein [Mucilaginibacter sp.]|uniref:DNA-binding protein n=1 Tax=Mucilaginibacter sp. TaxID=1882438 RepID=UPI0026254EA3|nr:DNA-binding protein [Mucilaginibacter sp.]